MLRVIERDEGDVVLDFESIKGKEVTNFKPRELLSWEYDEKKEIAFVEIDVDFAFADEPDRYHWVRVMQYAGEEDLRIKMIELFYDGGWIHKDFDFSKKEIEENPILSDLAEKLLKGARLPIVTGLTIQDVPPFCLTCKQPLGGYVSYLVSTTIVWVCGTRKFDARWLKPSRCSEQNEETLANASGIFGSSDSVRHL